MKFPPEIDCRICKFTSGKSSCIKSALAMYCFQRSSKLGIKMEKAIPENAREIALVLRVVLVKKFRGFCSLSFGSLCKISV